jgi:hypothetical protein
MYNLKLKLGTNKHYHEKRTVHWNNVTSVLLKLLKHRLINVTSFRPWKFLYSLSFLFKRTNNFGSVFPDGLGRRIYKNKFPTHVSFLFFPFSVSRIALTFPSRLKTFLLFITAAVLSLYQSTYLLPE